MPKLHSLSLLAFGASAALVAAATVSVCSAHPPVAAPPPAVAAPETSATSESVTLAGGCFWGVQAVFQHVDGVESAVSGYAGGKVANPSYREVSSGATGHAESVEVTFDPHKIGLGEILRIYFSVALDPTQVNRQGPDEGTQYRSAIFVADPAEANFAKRYIAQLDAAHIYPRPIATTVETGAAFYPAETYHQNYATLHPDEPYILFNDTPKVEALKQMFPERYREKANLLASR